MRRATSAQTSPGMPRRGYRIGELIVGDPWDTQHSSPLADPGLDVRPGDVILAVNGQRVDAETGPLQLLVNQADQEVLLTLAPRTPKGGERRQSADGRTGDDGSTTIDDKQVESKGAEHCAR